MTLLLALVLLLSVPLQQVSPDPCVVAAGPFVITSASSYRILFTVPSTTTSTSGSVIPNPVKSFKVQIDAGLFIDVGLPLAGPLCPPGSSYAGHWPYTVVMVTGVPKGPHNANVKVLYDSLDVNGLPIVVESAAVSIPFAAADPVRAVFPTIVGGRIIK